MFRRFRICTWNAQGLESKGRELHWIVQNNDIDICLLSETKLAPDTPFTVQGYELYRACHPYGLRRGGSAVLIKKSISHSTLTSIVRDCEHNYDRANTYVVFFQVARIQLDLFENVSYQIGSFYAPSGHAVLSHNFRWVFQQMGSHFLMGGDFNGHHESWDKDGSSNLAGKRLHKAIKEENMEIMAPTFYTHIPHQIGQKPGILDFFIGKNAEFLCNIPVVFANSTSDHKPVLIQMGFQDVIDTGISSMSVHSCGLEQPHDRFPPFHPKSEQSASDGSPSPFSRSDQPGAGISKAVVPGQRNLQSNTGSLVTVTCQPSTSRTKNIVLQPSVDNNQASSSMYKAASSTLRVSTWDSQGLVGKEHEVFQYVEDMDILMISDTHLFPKSLDIPDYKIYTAEHPFSANKGGSALLIRQSILHCELPPIMEDFVQIARVAIEIDNRQFQFGSLHFSPEYDHLPCEHYVDVFEELGTSSGFMIGGGFHAKHKYWNCNGFNKRGHQLLQLVKVLHLEVLVPSLATFYPVTGSEPEVMDFFIGKCLPTVGQSPQPYCNSLSEHKPIYVELKV